MLLRPLLLPLLVLFSVAGARAQQIDKKLIMVLPDTSREQLDWCNLNFGNGDDYTYWTAHRPVSVLTNEQTYGPFSELEGRGMAWLFSTEKEKDQYITSMVFAKMYGPYSGTVDFATTSTASGTAYTVSLADSISYYINGQLIATTDSTTVVGKWCVFSEKGNRLYTIKKGDWNYLIFNNRVMDSSMFYYNSLEIDDQNNYSYSLGYYEREQRGNCNLYFNIFKPIHHPPQPVFSPLKSLTGPLWTENDTTRFYGNTDGISYPACSMDRPPGRMYTRTLLTAGTKILMARYFFNETDVASIELCANGLATTLPYSEIMAPCIDSDGHYAFFGRRGYYLYKYVDGEEVKEPLSKFGVRANPVSIDTHGNTICYYETDDSVYLYENDRLFGSCAAGNFNCPAPGQGSGLQGWPPVFSMGNNSYVLYNNTISPPLLPIVDHDESSGLFNSGAVIYRKANEYGYWLLQKAGDKKYNLMINHRLISLPEGLCFEGPRLLCANLASRFSLTANEFIFYTKDGRNVYRYKLKI